MNRFSNSALNISEARIGPKMNSTLRFREITSLFSYYEVKNRARKGILRGLLRNRGLKFLFVVEQ
jgi:hypothetical protein